jgi:hypothetical protein
LRDILHPIATNTTRVMSAPHGSGDAGAPEDSSSA